jgi:hypothetical protein
MGSIKKGKNGFVNFKDGSALIHDTKNIMEIKKFYHLLLG